MKKFLKTKTIWYIAVIIISIPAFFALLKPGYYNMHDDMQIIRQLELEKCLNDGQIPCRWTPDLGYGYGYPLFNFYPPMPYFVGQIFRTFGFSFIWSVKLTAVLQIILSALFMYLLASSIFGKFGGLVSSTLYTYAPYHALNIYVRGAMNEAWSAVFFPLIFYFSKRLIQENKIKFLLGLSVSFAGLFLSHNPMVLTFTPILFLWCLYWILDQSKFKIKNILKQKNQIIKLLLSGILSISLSAFFTLPAVFETNLVQIESMFINYYHYSVHFASVYQLFISNFWNDGPSVWGPNDGMSFMIGYLHWILPIIIIISFAINTIKTKKINKTFLLSTLLAVIGFGTAFMVHNKSTFIWQIFPMIQKIQFPWRFLNHTVFLMSLSIGILPFLISKIFKNKKIQIAISSVILILVLILNINFFHPIHSGPITDTQKLSGKAWTNQITSGIYDYLPKTAKTAAKEPAKEFIDNIQPAEALINLYGGKKGTDWMLFNLLLKQSADITLSQLNFPNFKIQDNGQNISYANEPELGRMIIHLNSGEHQVFIKLHNTLIRNLANSISLIAWITLIICLTQIVWNKSKSKK